MTDNHRPTYLLVGTVTKDLHPDQSFSIGGTVTYASVVAQNMGWRPVIVTPAAADFEPPDYLSHLDWHVVPSPHTTTFRNEYDQHGHRQQTIGPVTRPIRPDEIPTQCRRASVVHLCPLAQEYGPDILSAFNGQMLVATPQGWLRQWDANGLVSLGDWRGAAQILPRLDVSIISIEDVDGNWSIAERWAAQTATLIVTMGDLGCTVFHRGQRFVVPPRPAQPVDPTGAGDVFAAAFTVRYVETGDLWLSARFANVTASMSIERPGPQGSPLRHEVDTFLLENPVERVSG